MAAKLDLWRRSAAPVWTVDGAWEVVVADVDLVGFGPDPVTASTDEVAVPAGAVLAEEPGACADLVVRTEELGVCVDLVLVEEPGACVDSVEKGTGLVFELGRAWEVVLTFGDDDTSG